MSATYVVEVLARTASTLVLRCSITHPDIATLPLPGHHPSWARLLLLGDERNEWESLRREDIWALSDRITRVELAELRDHPRLLDADRPSVTVRLLMEGGTPVVPDRWDAWLTLGDDAAAKWDPISEPKSSPRLVHPDGEPAGDAAELARSLETLRALARRGSGDAVHRIAAGLCHRVVASESRSAAIRSVLDGLHLTGTRLSSFAFVVDRAHEVVATYVVAAGQLRPSTALLALAALGRDAMPEAGAILARLSEGRSLGGPPKNDALRGSSVPSAYELLARRRCLADATPLKARVAAELGQAIAHQIPWLAETASAWGAAERAAFERSFGAVQANQAKARKARAAAASKSAAKRSPARRAAKK